MPQESDLARASLFHQFSAVNALLLVEATL